MSFCVYNVACLLQLWHGKLNDSHNCSTPPPPPPPPPRSYAPGYIQHNHKDLQAATLVCWCHVHVGSRVPREHSQYPGTGIMLHVYGRTTLQIPSHHLPHDCYANVMLPFTLLIVMLHIHVHNIHVHVYTFPATAECCSHATISYGSTSIHSCKTSNVK